jgi:ankyrin repeat protein
MVKFLLVLVFVFASYGCATSQVDDQTAGQADQSAVAADPWFRAARTADVAQLKGMLAGGKSIDTTSAVGVTALLVASRMGNLETIQWLLENGANVNHRDRDGQSALGYALTGLSRGPKRVQVVETLIKAGGDPFVVDAIGFIPVQEMLNLEMDELLKSLSYTDKKPCDRMPKLKGEMSLSQYARKMERIEIAEFFEKQGCW